MPLIRAIAALNRTSRIPVEVGPQLIAGVQGEVTNLVAAGQGIQAKPVSAAAGNYTAYAIRPIEALHRLSLATAPFMHQSVFNIHRQWSIFKYLDAFDVDQHGLLKLSQSAGLVRENQRRLMSEELGVGFSCLIAESWARATGIAGAIEIVDVDQLLRYGRTWNNVRQPGVTVGTRRPDYLLISNSGGQAQVRSLECKGSKEASGMYPRLARAVTQLGSIQLGGQAIQGLACALTSNEEGLEISMVDPESPDFKIRLLPEIALTPGLDLSFEGNDELSNFDPPQFASGALGVAAGGLAAYSGNFEAEKKFLNPDLYSNVASRQVERTRAQVNGTDFVGQSSVVRMPSGEGLEIFTGIMDTVDVSLSEGSIVDLGAAQQLAWDSFREGTGGKGVIDGRQNTSVVSVASNGSIFAVSILD